MVKGSVKNTCLKMDRCEKENIGRPKQIITRSSTIKFRVTPLEKEVIENYANYANLNISDYCRKSAFNKRIYKPLNEEELGVFKTLNQFYINFKRLGNLIRNKDENLFKEIEETTSIIKQHLRKFMNV